ncbi:MAG: sodium/glucose cotransporter [Bacteroidia bacterium]|nr:MAG: sodium/glucose cotransporter [Bacteroidia bacterium]
MHFSAIDFLVFFGYCAIILGIGLFIAKRKGTGDAEGYFLASKALPWWAIGTSLIAANISAEQMIGMAGSGFAIGLAIASYEWMGALTLLIVAKFMIPIFLDKGIYSMPQFLGMRYDERVRSILAVFWLLVYIFVNLTSILYLGAVTMETILGIPLIYGIIGLAVFAAAYTIYGGLKAVAWTDVIQVSFLVGGGLLTTWLALNAFSGGEGAIAGFIELFREVPGHFEMVLGREHEFYYELPGIGVLIGGLWVANISYWGFNQYIIQRGLAAKSVAEAQKGLMFAGYLKLLMPLIVVIPGIVAFGFGADLPRPDGAYPWLLAEFIPVGLRGLAFAALIAAIASSLASMTNSTSTIFTMDIFRVHFNKKASEKTLVVTGRIVSFLALLIAVLVAPQVENFGQAFQFIQEFTGFVSPGVVAIFLLGLFWKRATANSAVWAAIFTIPSGFILRWLYPGLPFLDRMGIVFLFLCTIMVAISLYESSGKDPNAIEYKTHMFRTTTSFNIGSIGICAILAVLYLLFW